jgi:hypothetical protein
MNDPELEEFSAWFAEAVARSGAAVPVTVEQVRERLVHYMDVAKQELAAIGPEESSQSSDFKPTATIIGPHGGDGDICIAFQQGHKRRMMQALSDTCHISLAQAVIVRMASTIANFAQIGEDIGLKMPEDPRNNRQKLEYFNERVFKWMRQQFGSTHLGDLTKKYRHDALVVSAIGPRVPDMGLLTIYKWNDGKLEFKDARGKDGEWIFDGMVNEMIPRWWQ